jgi:hypothetical protein
MMASDSGTVCGHVPLDDDDFLLQDVRLCSPPSMGTLRLSESTELVQAEPQGLDCLWKLTNSGNSKKSSQFCVALAEPSSGHAVDSVDSDEDLGRVCDPFDDDLMVPDGVLLLDVGLSSPSQDMMGLASVLGIAS